MPCDRSDAMEGDLVVGSSGKSSGDERENERRGSSERLASSSLIESVSFKWFFDSCER